MRAKYIFLFLLITFYQKNGAFAQLVTDNAFLAGKWLQVCIAPNGSWGNTVTVPAGYATRPGSSLSYSDPILGTTPSGDGMDFSYDQGHDGWAVGTPPWYGAFFLPGTPFNGWQIEIDDTMAAAFYSSGLSRQYDTSEGGNFGGTVTGWSGPTCWNPQAPNAGTWTGSYGIRRPGLRNALAITIINEIDSFASWCNVTVKLHNMSDSTLHGVYYMASGDPDNDEVLPGGSFPTDNHISYQGGALDRHEVNARPDPGSHPDAFSGLATQDCRAKVFIYQSWPPAVTPGNNLNRVWAGTTSSMGTVDYALGATTSSQDIAYGIIFNVGDLAPGATEYVSYAWIFSDTTAVDSIFTAQPKLSTLGNVYPSTRRDTVSGCDLSGCNVTGLYTFDADIVGGDTRKWTYSGWSWSPSIGLSTTTGTHVSIDIAALTGATEYTITGTPATTIGSCTPPSPLTFHLFVQPCFFASNNSAICVYDTLKLFTHGDSTGASYLWYGPGGFLSTAKNPIRTGMTMADAGVYTAVRIVGTSRDTTTTTVTLIPKPIITATSNSPVCSTVDTLKLFAAPDSVGETFAWRGPVGFASTLVNPMITPPHVPNSGLYKVVATFHGCKDSATTTAVVDSTPAVPTLTSNSPICSHRDSLKFNATDVTAGVTYVWSGPLAFTASIPNPFVTRDVPLGAAGVYSVTATLGRCKNYATITTVVNKTPAVPALTTNAPVCSGFELDLGATSDAGSLFRWRGPNGFIATGASPSINPAYVPATGVYSVSATLFYPGIPAGCTSDTATIRAVVDSTPMVPIMSSNSPICSHRDSLKLRATTTAGSSYLWRGPLAFASLAQNPVINPDLPVTASGIYKVIVSLGICRDSSIINVTVNKTPDMPTVTTTAPVCSGSPIFFTASSDVGAVYNWDGPNGFTGGSANAIIANAYTPATGIYSVSATLYYAGIPGGCTSDTATITAIVDSTVNANFRSTLKYGCKADTVDFTNTSLMATTFRWNFGDSASAFVRDPRHIYATQGIYSITLTAIGGACRDSVTQVDTLIHPLKAVFSSDQDIICQGSTVAFTDASVNPQIPGKTAPSFAWYFGDGGVAAGLSPTHKYTTSGVYKAFEVATNFVPCHDTAYKLISVDSMSDVKIHISDAVMCTGDAATYTGIYTDIGNTGVIWDFGNGDTVLNMNPVTFAYKAAGSYTVTSTALYRVCPTATTTKNIYVGQAPQVYLGPDTTICKGSSAFALRNILNTGSGATWKWSTGETGSNIQVVAPGTYYATVTLGGCSASDTVVVKNDCYINLPNVFTPNGDGVNDYFFPRQLLTSGLVSFSMNIYNRWGELLFTSTSLTGQGWDGKFNGVPQPEGVFIYVIDAAFKDGQKEHHQGNVTLLR